MKNVLALLFVLSIGSAFASGPMDRDAWRTADAVSKTEYSKVDSCTKAFNKAKAKAEKVSSKEQNSPDKKGFYVDSRDCSVVATKAMCKCRRLKNDKLRCYYKGDFLCTEWVYHEDQ